MNSILLDILSIGAIVSAILVITSKNPVISVLFLICVFVNIAGYLIQLEIGFIGISYIIVYVGAIAILFLFVIMMLNLQLSELSASSKEYTQNLPLGALLGTIILFEFVSILPFTFKDKASFTLSTLNNIVDNSELHIWNWFNSLFFSSNNFTNSKFYTTENTDKIYEIFNYTMSDIHFSSFLQIQSIANILYCNAAIWLIITSIILLIAMIGPIILSLEATSKKLKGYELNN